MFFDWQTTHAAIWRGETSGFKAAKRIDPIGLSNLLDIDEEKTLLLSNTRRFLAGQPSNHALLWGARGTGKSSLIKAVFNALRNEGLRLIEVDRDHLADLPLIADAIEDAPYRFILFCDDLSFENDEKGYKGLKRILEGSIELPPDNLRVYATSNRRHLLPEYLSENNATVIKDGEIHYADVVEEKLSLSDRFGLSLSFYSGGEDHYLKLIENHFKEYRGDKNALMREAKQFAALRASRSGRTAKQFIGYFEQKL